jgi:hypothetical protein
VFLHQNQCLFRPSLTESLFPNLLPALRSVRIRAQNIIPSSQGFLLGPRKVHNHTAHISTSPHVLNDKNLNSHKLNRLKDIQRNLAMAFLAQLVQFFLTARASAPQSMLVQIFPKRPK